MENKFDVFLKSNSKAVPPAPLNEWRKIMSKIEDQKSFIELFRDMVANRNFWLASLVTAGMACAVVLNVNKTSSLDEQLTVTAGLFSEDLSTGSSSILE